MCAPRRLKVRAASAAMRVSRAAWLRNLWLSAARSGWPRITTGWERCKPPVTRCRLVGSVAHKWHVPPVGEFVSH